MKELRHIQNSLENLCVCVRACVRACVRVCVCLCVCLYSSTVKASFDCKMSKAYLRCSDQLSFVVNIYLGASAKFFQLHIRKCDVSPPEKKNSSPQHPGDKTIWYHVLCEKMICDEKIPKIRRLL